MPRSREQIREELLNRYRLVSGTPETDPVVTEPPPTEIVQEVFAHEEAGSDDQSNVVEAVSSTPPVHADEPTPISIDASSESVADKEEIAKVTNEFEKILELLAILKSAKEDQEFSDALINAKAEVERLESLAIKFKGKGITEFRDIFGQVKHILSMAQNEFDKSLVKPPEEPTGKEPKKDGKEKKPEVEILDAKDIEDQIRQILSTMSGVERIDSLTVTGDGDTLSLDAKLTGKKGFVSTDITITGAKLSVAQGKIKVSEHTVRSSKFEGRVKGMIDKKMGLVDEKVKEYLANKKGKPVETVSIEEGKVKVTYRDEIPADTGGEIKRVKFTPPEDGTGSEKEGKEKLKEDKENPELEKFKLAKEALELALQKAENNGSDQLGQNQAELQDAEEKYQQARAEYIAGNIEKYEEVRSDELKAIFKNQNKDTAWYKKAVQGIAGFNRKLGEWNLHAGLEKTGYKIDNRVAKIMLRSVNARTAISGALLGGAWIAGSGIAAGFMLAGRSGLSGVASGVGSHDMMAQMRQKWDRGNIEKILKETGKLKEGEIAVAGRVALERLDDAVDNMVSQAIFDGANYEDLAKDTLYQQLIQKRNEILAGIKVTAGPEAEGNDSLVQLLEQRSSEADERLDAALKGKKIKSRNRKLIASALGAVSAGWSGYRLWALDGDQNAVIADKVAEKLQEDIEQSHVDNVVATQKLVALAEANQKEALPTDIPAPKIGPGEGTMMGPGVKASELGESASDGVIKTGVDKVPIVHNGKDSGAWLETKADGSVSIHAGTRGIEGAMLDLKTTDPERYKNLIEKLQEYKSDTPGADNSHGALVHRFAQKFQEEHPGKDLDWISKGEIALDKDGTPEIKDVEYLNKATGSVAEIEKNTDTGSLDTAFAPKSATSLSEFLKNDPSLADESASGVGGAKLENIFDAGQAQGASPKVSAPNASGMVEVLRDKDGEPLYGVTRKPEVAQMILGESQGLSLPELRGIMSTDWQDIHFKALGLNKDSLAELRSSNMTVAQLQEKIVDGSDSKFVLQFGKLADELKGKSIELGWTESDMNKKVFDGFLEYAKHEAKISPAKAA